jgi:hypothetical protein
MLSRFRTQTLGFLAGATLVVGVLAGGPSVAQASTVVPAVVTTLNQNGLNDVNYIRNFFLCVTSCSANSVMNEKGAQIGLTGLASAIKAATAAHLGSTWSSPIATLAADNTQLLKTLGNVKSTDTKFVLGTNIYVINYQTALMATDLYRLQSLSLTKPLTFKYWDVGITAALNAVGLFTQKIATGGLSTTNEIFTYQRVADAAHLLATHANGPSASFDAQLRRFAVRQAAVAQSATLVLEGKKAPLTAAQIASDSASAGAALRALVTRQNTL